MSLKYSQGDRNNPDSLMPPKGNEDGDAEDKLVQRQNLSIYQSKVKGPGTEPHKCETCGKVFKSKQLLRLHASDHPVANKLFVCKVCGQHFAVQALLQNHMQRHSKERKHVCDICGKSYLTKADALMHKRRHTMERRFLCLLCQKKFVYLSELNAHLKKHIGMKLQKNIACDICGKYFITHRDLNRHLNVHTGAQPFECPLCGKKFSQEVNMQVHIKIHTNVKPHQCLVCEKRFITKSKLLRHQVTHFNSTSKEPVIKAHKCHLCTKSYSAVNSLTRHLQGHHAMSQISPSCSVALRSDRMVTATPGSNQSTLKRSGDKTGDTDINQTQDHAKKNSKFTSHSTQTLFDTNNSVLASRPPSSHTSPLSEKDLPTQSLELSQAPTPNQTNSSVETIIVKPKGEIVNFAPTDQRKFVKPRFISPGVRKSKKSKLQHIPIATNQNADFASVNPVNEPQVFFLHPSPQSNVHPIIVMPCESMQPESQIFTLREDLTTNVNKKNSSSDQSQECTSLSLSTSPVKMNSCLVRNGENTFLLPTVEIGDLPLHVLQGHPAMNAQESLRETAYVPSSPHLLALPQTLPISSSSHQNCLDIPKAMIPKQSLHATEHSTNCRNQPAPVVLSNQKLTQPTPFILTNQSLSQLTPPPFLQPEFITADTSRLLAYPAGSTPNWISSPRVKTKFPPQKSPPLEILPAPKLPVSAGSLLSLSQLKVEAPLAVKTRSHSSFVLSPQVSTAALDRNEDSGCELCVVSRTNNPLVACAFCGFF